MAATMPYFMNYKKMHLRRYKKRRGAASVFRKPSLRKKDDVVYPEENLKIGLDERKEDINSFIVHGSPIMRDALSKSSNYFENCFHSLIDNLPAETQSSLRIFNIDGPNSLSACKYAAISRVNRGIIYSTDLEYGVIYSCTKGFGLSLTLYSFEFLDYGSSLSFTRKLSEKLDKYYSGRHSVTHLKMPGLVTTVEKGFLFAYLLYYTGLIILNSDKDLSGVNITPERVQYLLRYLFKRVFFGGGLVINTAGGEKIMKLHHETLANALKDKLHVSISGIDSCYPMAFDNSERSLESIVERETARISTMRDRESEEEYRKSFTRFKTSTRDKLVHFNQPFPVGYDPSSLRDFEGRGFLVEIELISNNRCNWPFLTLAYMKHLACADDVRVSKREIHIYLEETSPGKYTVEETNLDDILDTYDEYPKDDDIMIYKVAIICEEECEENWSHSATLVMDTNENKFFMFDPHMYKHGQDKWGIQSYFEKNPLGYRGHRYDPWDIGCPDIQVQGYDELCSSWNLYYIATLIVNYSHCKGKDKEDKAATYNAIRHVLSVEGMYRFHAFIYQSLRYTRWAPCKIYSAVDDTVAMFHLARHQTLQRAIENHGMHPLFPDKIRNEYLLPARRGYTPPPAE
jgi:hypothetical protein